MDLIIAKEGKLDNKNNNSLFSLVILYPLLIIKLIKFKTKAKKLKFYPKTI